MKKVFLFLFLGFMVLTLAGTADARSGCCSHHLGVRADGCGCNDGTPLSDTCAPYYICTATQDNTSSSTTSNTNAYQPVYVVPTATPVPPTYTPIPLPTVTPTPKPTSTPVPTNNVVKPTTVPTTAVLGAHSKSNGADVLVVLLAPIVIIGSLWWGKRMIKNI